MRYAVLEIAFDGSSGCPEEGIPGGGTEISLAACDLSEEAARRHAEERSKEEGSPFTTSVFIVVPAWVRPAQ